MANTNFQGRKPEGGNYLYYLLGGIALVALFLIFVMPSLPMGGCVGVVELNGEIVTQDIPPSLISDGVKGSETIASEIESAGKRQDVKSVLVVIDSPGGSVVGSKEIYDALRALDKPSVAYINELGASGGYYVAAGTGYIVSQPDALTGNIGARITLSDFSGLFEKIGYNETSVKSGALKDMGTYSRPLTPEEQAVFGSIINESFQEFRSAVEQGRSGKLDVAEFQKILDGRILSGRQAKKVGLVDELGNKKAALKKAAELGGLDSSDPKICELSSTQGTRGLLGSLSSQAIDFVARGAGIARLSYR